MSEQPEKIFEPVYTDAPEKTLKPGENIQGIKETIEGGFTIGGLKVIVSAGAASKIVEINDGVEVRIYCIAPGKFEVWA